jgi:hypothetical protein
VTVRRVVVLAHVALAIAAVPSVVSLLTVTSAPKLDVAFTVRVSAAASPRVVLPFAVNAPDKVVAPVTARLAAEVPVGRLAASVERLTFLAGEAPAVAIRNSSAGAGEATASCPEMNVARGFASTTWFVSADALRTLPFENV